MCIGVSSNTPRRQGEPIANAFRHLKYQGAAPNTAEHTSKLCGSEEPAVGKPSPTIRVPSSEMSIIITDFQVRDSESGSN
jgi:hypothetical protein